MKDQEIFFSKEEPIQLIEYDLNTKRKEFP